MDSTVGMEGHSHHHAAPLFPMAGFSALVSLKRSFATSKYFKIRPGFLGFLGKAGIFCSAWAMALVDLFAKQH
jgi:hypothetical protein